MEIFDKLVIPPSSNILLLLKYILIISLVLFVPYVCMMMGASYFSVYFGRKYERTKNLIFMRFSKDIIEKLTITKNAELALGTIPVLSVIFAYAQLLLGAKTITLDILALSGLIFIVAFILIYKYRGAFQIGSVLDRLKGLAGSGASSAEEISGFEKKLKDSRNRSGRLGLYMIFSASYLFTGSVSLASDPARWPHVVNILQVIFSWETVFGYLYLLSAAGLITGGAIIFYFFKWPAISGGKSGKIEDISGEYAEYVKSFAGGLAFFSCLALPLFMFLSLMFLPGRAFSGSVFAYTVLGLVCALVLCNLLYSVFKSTDIRSAAVMFILIFAVLTFNIVKDQLAFENAISEQKEVILVKAEEHEKEVRSKSVSVSVSGVSGEQIYDLKCAACHKFDQKLVGPPHNQVVPKYNGDVQKLANYIFNPVKVDPAYPPMPGPGLKKKEAVAVAQYLIDKLSGKK